MNTQRNPLNGKFVSVKSVVEAKAVIADAFKKADNKSQHRSATVRTVGDLPAAAVEAVSAVSRLSVVATWREIPHGAYYFPDGMGMGFVLIPVTAAGEYARKNKVVVRYKR